MTTADTSIQAVLTAFVASASGSYVHAGRRSMRFTISQLRLGEIRFSQALVFGRRARMGISSGPPMGGVSTVAGAIVNLPDILVLAPAVDVFRSLLLRQRR